MYTGIGLFGLGNSNIFPVMFSQALVRVPGSQNEVSGLMITGISGGAIFPLLMGVASDTLKRDVYKRQLARLLPSMLILIPYVRGGLFMI